MQLPTLTQLALAGLLASPTVVGLQVQPANGVARYAGALAAVAYPAMMVVDAAELPVEEVEEVEEESEAKKKGKKGKKTLKLKKKKKYAKKLSAVPTVEVEKRQWGGWGWGFGDDEEDDEGDDEEDQPITTPAKGAPATTKKTKWTRPAPTATEPGPVTKKARPTKSFSFTRKTRPTVTFSKKSRPRPTSDESVAPKTTKAIPTADTPIGQTTIHKTMPTMSFSPKSTITAGVTIRKSKSSAKSIPTPTFLPWDDEQ